MTERGGWIDRQGLNSDGLSQGTSIKPCFGNSYSNIPIPQSRNPHSLFKGAAFLLADVAKMRFRYRMIDASMLCAAQES